jgi:hypothetical protein
MQKLQDSKSGEDLEKNRGAYGNQTDNLNFGKVEPNSLPSSPTGSSTCCFPYQNGI